MPTHHDAEVTPAQVAAAFDLGTPRRPLQFVSFTNKRTWRLDTDRGSYLVKEVWPGADLHWAPSLTARSDYERLAADAGIACPQAIEPRDPAYGLIGRIDGTGAYRVYEWVEGRQASESDDLAEWIGGQAALLHRLHPLGGAVRLDWRWDGITDAAGWHRWAALAGRQHRPWAATLRDQLDLITSTVGWTYDAWRRAADDVISHRDVELFNVMVTDRGPMLVDWDSVGAISATLELGCVAHIFGRDVAGARRVIGAYAAGGGHVADVGDGLCAAAVAHRIGFLAKPIRVAVGDAAAGRRTPAELDADIARRLDQLPGLVEDLRTLGAEAMRN